MKNILQKLGLICVFLFSITAYAQQGNSLQHQAPIDIQNYVKNHFPNLSIVEFEVDNDDALSEYEIELNNGTELEFNHEFKIKKIESQFELPSSVIPFKIRQFVIENYPNLKITDWELNRNHQEIKLNNDLELEFGLNDDFIKIDD